MSGIYISCTFTHCKSIFTNFLSSVNFSLSHITWLTHHGMSPTASWAVSHRHYGGKGDVWGRGWRWDLRRGRLSLNFWLVLSPLSYFSKGVTFQDEYKGILPKLIVTEALTYPGGEEWLAERI